MSLQDDDFGCPLCGSVHCRRLSGPDDRSSDVEDLDEENSGHYKCLRCGDEYYVEIELKIKMTQLPKFSPHARCPYCKSYKTQIRATNPVKQERSHNCKNCLRVFLTSRLDVE